MLLTSYAAIGSLSTGGKMVTLFLEADDVMPSASSFCAGQYTSGLTSESYTSAVIP